MARLIRTTIRPGEEILVEDAEYAQLLRQGLVYGEALPAPPDPDDVEVASFLDNETSQTYARLLAQLAAAVDAGTGVLPDALRAAFGRAPKPSGGDDSAALIAAANAFPGGKGVLVLEPNSTYIAQGLPIRDGLAWWGYGTTIRLPASPTASMFRTTGTTAVNSGGIYGATLIGDATGEKGVGATQRGVDCSSLDTLERYDIHDCFIQGFTYGIHGSENGGVGNDRWLHVQATRVWYCQVGIKGNEHPILNSVDLRANDVGLTGRLNDMTATGVKITYNRVGVEPEAVRGGVTNCTFAGVTAFRNDVGMRLSGGNTIEGIAIDGTSNPGCIGIELLVSNNNISGIRATQASTTECETTIMVRSGAWYNSVSGTIRQVTAGRRALYAEAGTNSLQTDLRLELTGGASGIVCASGSSRSDLKLRAAVSGDGKALDAPNLSRSRVRGYVLIQSATRTTPAVDIPSNGGTGNDIDLTIASSNSGQGPGASIDARNSYVKLWMLPGAGLPISGTITAKDAASQVVSNIVLAGWP